MFALLSLKLAGLLSRSCSRSLLVSIQECDRKICLSRHAITPQTTANYCKCENHWIYSFDTIRLVSSEPNNHINAWIFNLYTFNNVMQSRHLVLVYYVMQIIRMHWLELFLSRLLKWFTCYSSGVFSARRARRPSPATRRGRGTGRGAGGGGGGCLSWRQHGVLLILIL